MNHPIELLLPTPLLLLALLAILTFVSFRQPAGSWLRRSRFVWVVMLVWFYGISLPKFADVLMVALEGSPTREGLPVPVPDERAVIVVLSSGEMRTPKGRTRVRFDVMGWERVRGGVELWRQTGGRMIFTGGPPGPAEQSLAGASANLAQELGVPAGQTELSAGAVNTEEEMRQLQARLKDHRGPLWLVTSAIHMPRSLAIAKSLGLDFTPYPVGFRQIADHTWRSWVPGNGTLPRAQAVLHEYVGLWVYRVRRITS